MTLELLCIREVSAHTLSSSWVDDFKVSYGTKTYLHAMLTGRAVGDGQGSINKVILDVHHNESRDWANHLNNRERQVTYHVYLETFLAHSMYLFDPVVPTVHKLLLVHTTILK